MISVFCWDCGKKIEFSDSVGFRAECDSCGADAHVCKNCDFYDPKVYNECRETSADVVREKERNNYCEYFQVRASEGSGVDKKQDLLSAAEALFKKK